MLAGVNGRTRTVLSGAGRGRGTRRLGWAAAALAGSAAVFCCALAGARQMGMQADGASMVLQGWAMGHGNPLLHGWYLADVTFYTTELPEYLLVAAFRGIRPDVVAICSALTYTLLVVLAAAIAYQAGSSRRARVTGAVIAVAVMLAPGHAATATLLNDPDHVGSAVPVLLAFLLCGRLLDGRPRSGARRWALAAAVAVILGWAMAGDPLIELVGIVPLVLVCGGRTGWRLLIRRQPRASAAPEFSLAVAGLAAAVAGAGLGRLIRAAGGFTVHPLVRQHAVPLATLPRNAAGVAEDFGELFSVHLAHARVNAWLAVTAVHLVFACLVAGALVLALARFFRGDDLVSGMLAAGIVVNMAAYALLYEVSPSTAREIGPVFGLGAALAGRVLGERAVRWRLERLVAVGAVAALAILPPTLLAVVPGRPAAADVAAFLTGHHLRTGLGGYWQANNVTVETGGRVTVIPVINQPGTGLVPYKWELDSALLRATAPPANFVVAAAPFLRAGSSGVTEREAVALFGNPDRVYRLGSGYTILIWRKNLLPELPRV